MGIPKIASAAIDDYTKHLSPAEKRFIRENTGVSLMFYAAAQKASQEALKRYRGEGHNGRGDAFRHAYWSALMTRNAGLLMARRYGYAHEAVPPGDGIHPVIVGKGTMLTQPRAEREMDEFNNAVGRAIGAANPTANDQELAEQVNQALKGGRLRILSHK